MDARARRFTPQSAPVFARIGVRVSPAPCLLIAGAGSQVAVDQGSQIIVPAPPGQRSRGILIAVIQARIGAAFEQKARDLQMSACRRQMQRRDAPARNSKGTKNNKRIIGPRIQCPTTYPTPSKSPRGRDLNMQACGSSLPIKSVPFPNRD